MTVDQKVTLKVLFVLSSIVQHETKYCIEAKHALINNKATMQ